MNRSIFICSGGRCGTHWIRPILAQLLDLEIGFGLKGYNPNKVPFKTEPGAIWKIKIKEKRELGGNIYSGHMPITELLPIISLVNIIILIRDPKDMCISAAYYTSDREKLSQEQFEKNLKVQLVMGGPNLDFNESYIKSKSRIPHFLLKYEEMIADDYGSIVKVLDTFRYPYEEEKLKFVLKKNSFKNLSGGREVGEEDNSAFYRKGVIGDWANYFTSDMLKEFNLRHKKLLKEWGY